jgi:hypothetical protein
VSNKTKKYQQELCPECTPQAGCLTFDTLSLISTDGTVKIDKKIQGGKYIHNLRVNVLAAPFLKSNSDTIVFEGDSKTTPLKAHVKISTLAVGNILGYDNTGLYVVPGALTETPNSKTDSPTVSITLGGTALRNIRADLKISQTANNAITLQPDGVYVSAISAVQSDLVFFYVGDAGFPSAGQNTYSPAGNLFLNRKVMVFRNQLIQRPTDPGNGDTYITKPFNSNTLTFSAPLGADEFVFVLVI